MNWETANGLNIFLNICFRIYINKETKENFFQNYSAGPQNQNFGKKPFLYIAHLLTQLPFLIM